MHQRFDLRTHEAVAGLRSARRVLNHQINFDASQLSKCRNLARDSGHASPVVLLFNVRENRAHDSKA